MDLRTPLCRQLGIPLPIFLAPLGGGPSTPELVAAVSESGGLGSLGGAYYQPADLDLILGRIKALTTRPFAVNLFAPGPVVVPTEGQLAAALEATRVYRQELGLPEPALKPPYEPDFAAQMSVVIKHRPAVFSFTFGIPDDSFLQECRRAGIVIMGTATTPADGLTLQARGVDGVMAQGFEAGGHRALFSPLQEDEKLATLPLTQALVAALQLPVVASGGLMNGRQVGAVLAAGAQAAALGTAFMICPEAGTPAAYRQALRAGGPTRLTRAFSGRWARGLSNRFMAEMEASPLLPFPAQNAFTRDIRQRASQAGRAEFLSLWAGEGVGQLREIGAAELMELLAAELRGAAPQRV